jgi:hypothetical protein
VLRNNTEGKVQGNSITAAVGFGAVVDRICDKDIHRQWYLLVSLLPATGLLTFGICSSASSDSNSFIRSHNCWDWCRDCSSSAFIDWCTRVRHMCVVFLLLPELFCQISALDNWVWCAVLVGDVPIESMNWWNSGLCCSARNGSASLLFVMMVMVLQFVSDSQ